MADITFGHTETITVSARGQRAGTLTRIYVDAAEAGFILGTVTARANDTTVYYLEDGVFTGSRWDDRGLTFSKLSAIMRGDEVDQRHITTGINRFPRLTDAKSMARAIYSAGRLPTPAEVCNGTVNALIPALISVNVVGCIIDAACYELMRYYQPGKGFSSRASNLVTFAGQYDMAVRTQALIESRLKYCEAKAARRVS